MDVSFNEINIAYNANRGVDIYIYISWEKHRIAGLEWKQNGYVDWSCGISCKCLIVVLS